MTMTSPPSIPRLISLQSTLLSSCHERARLLTLSTSTSSPSPSSSANPTSVSVSSSQSVSLNRSVSRNLSNLASALNDLLTSRRTVKSKEASEDNVRQLLKGWESVVGILNEDPTGRAMVDEVLKSHPILDPSNVPSEDAPRPFSSDPYTDDDAPVLAPPAGTTQDTRTTTELLSSQHSSIATQDRHLDLLSASIGRQHALSLQMNEELEDQAGLLDGLDQDVERAQLGLDRASGRLRRVERSLKENGSTWTIVGAIFILILLIAIFK